MMVLKSLAPSQHFPCPPPPLISPSFSICLLNLKCYICFVWHRSSVNVGSVSAGGVGGGTGVNNTGTLVASDSWESAMHYHHHHHQPQQSYHAPQSSRETSMRSGEGIFTSRQYLLSLLEATVFSPPPPPPPKIVIHRESFTMVYVNCNG